MKKISIALFCLLQIGAFGQISEKRVESLVSFLASDEMKGRDIGTPENDSAAVYIARQFAANRLDFCFGESYLIPFEYKGQITYNVCGLQKGNSEKTIAFGGHFDHIGTAKSGTDTIYNGADDNASGTAAVIALSDYFKEKKPEFTLVYMAFNGEEKGMKGSKALADLPALQPLWKNTAALFNFEMLGTVSAFGANAVYMTGNDVSNLHELLTAAAPSSFSIAADPYLKQQLFYRSDNISFTKKDVVAHSFSTVDMNTARHYHQLNDDMDVIKVPNLTAIINHFGRTVENLSPAAFNPAYNNQLKLKR